MLGDGRFGDFAPVESIQQTHRYESFTEDVPRALMGRVRLIRKLAQKINGIDLSSASTGDELELSPREAELLIAEGWAAPITAVADDREPRRSRRTGPTKPSR